MLLLALLMFTLVPLYASAQAAPVANAVACGTAEKHAVYAPFTSFFTNTPLLAVGCGEGEVAVAAGGGGAYVYRYGYIREENSDSWRQFSFSGDQQVGEWVVGTATAAVPAVRDGDVLAYVCERIAGAWKCGCSTEACTTNTWHHRAYTFPVPQLATTEIFADLEYDRRFFDIPQITEDDLYLYQLSSGFLFAGDVVTVTGQNFVPHTPTTLFIGDSAPIVAEEVTVNSATFRIPAGLPYGAQVLSVKNNGKNAKNTLQAYVEEKITEKPSIVSISPTTITQGDMVTITGTGFHPERNTIITGFGVIDAVPSTQNGTVITFRYEPFTEHITFRTESGRGTEQAWRAYIGVLHAGGASNVQRVMLQF
jgi:hypothetical protein